MPTVLRQDGFSVRIYTHDHPPPHVHVWKSGARAKIGIMPMELLVSTMSPRDTLRSVRIVEKHEDLLWQKWKELHGAND